MSIARLTALLIAIPSACDVTSAEDPVPRPPIIDVHAHVYSSDPRFDHHAPNPVTGKPLTADDEESHRRATLAEMDRYNIVKAVVSNDYDTVLRWKSAAPDRILCSYAFSIPDPPDADTLRDEHRANRLVSFGEIGLQYAGLAPTDPRMEPWYELAVELDVPMAFHVGLTKPGGIYDAYPDYRAALSDPLVLEEVLIRHPDLRVSVMHAGWPMLDSMIALMWAHPQVYVDISVINWAVPPARVSYLPRAPGGRRLRPTNHVRLRPDGLARGHRHGNRRRRVRRVPYRGPEARHLLQQRGAVLPAGVTAFGGCRFAGLLHVGGACVDRRFARSLRE